MAPHTVGDVGPAFKKNSPRATFDGNIQAAFKSNAVVGAMARVGEHFLQGFGSLAGALHQFFAGRWCVADAACDFVALNFDCSVQRELGGKAGGSFLDRLEFGAAGAPDSDAACVHGNRGPVSAVYWEKSANLLANLAWLRKTRGKSGAGWPSPCAFCLRARRQAKGESTLDVFPMPTIVKRLTGHSDLHVIAFRR